MLAIGNLSLAGEEVPVENPAPDAPFVYVYIPSGQEGMYGMMISNIVPETPTISISKFKETVVTIPRKYLPNGLGSGVQQITLTLIEDTGTGTTTVVPDVDFETAWALTDAELQSAITVKKESRYLMYPASFYNCASFISRMVVPEVSIRLLQIRFHSYMDFADCMGLSDRTYSILWGTNMGGMICHLEDYVIDSLPEMTKYEPGITWNNRDEMLFVANPGGRWAPYDSSSVAEELYKASSYHATRDANGNIALSANYDYNTAMSGAYWGSTSRLILTDSATGNKYLLPLVSYNNEGSTEDDRSMTFGATIGTETFLIEWKKAGITSIAQ